MVHRSLQVRLVAFCSGFTLVPDSKGSVRLLGLRVFGVRLSLVFV